MTDSQIRFTLGAHNRTLRDWAISDKPSALTNARNHAKRHGAAGMWRADESFLLLYRDGGKIRMRLWSKGRPA